MQQTTRKSDTSGIGSIFKSVLQLTFGLFPPQILVINSVFRPLHIFIRFQLQVNNLVLLLLLWLRLDEDGSGAVASCFLYHFKLKLIFTF